MPKTKPSGVGAPPGEKKESIFSNDICSKGSRPEQVQLDSSGECDLMLSALRAATARAKLAANQFDSIGISLRQKLITCEQALQWARDEDLIGWIRLGPPEVQK